MTLVNNVAQGEHPAGHCVLLHSDSADNGSPVYGDRTVVYCAGRGGYAAIRGIIDGTGRRKFHAYGVNIFIYAVGRYCFRLFGGKAVSAVIIAERAGLIEVEKARFSVHSAYAAVYRQIMEINVVRNRAAGAEEKIFLVDIQRKAAAGRVNKVVCTIDNIGFAWSQTDVR